MRLTLVRLLPLAAALLGAGFAASQSLTAPRLGVLYNLDDGPAPAVAEYYAKRRSIPAANVLGIHLGSSDVISPAAFSIIRNQVIGRLPGEVQSLALVWSKPFAVGCMSVTTAMAAGYRPSFCEPGCADTALNPVFDQNDWLPADTVGWLPAMLIPSDDVALARALIERGIASDGTAPRGTLYLVRTADGKRNVRAVTYGDIAAGIGEQLHTTELAAPVTHDVQGAIGYFTGTARVEELSRIRFLPGALADHLTSAGGVLHGGAQTSAGEWLAAGATASYGNVSEPCNHLEKFPDIALLMHHYLLGDTALEAYWKSVKMPGQGLFVGEPLARPYRSRR